MWIGEKLHDEEIKRCGHATHATKVSSQIETTDKHTNNDTRSYMYSSSYSLGSVSLDLDLCLFNVDATISFHQSLFKWCKKLIEKKKSGSDKCKKTNTT